MSMGWTVYEPSRAPVVFPPGEVVLETTTLDDHTLLEADRLVSTGRCTDGRLELESGNTRLVAMIHKSAPYVAGLQEGQALRPVPLFVWDPTYEELLSQGFRVLRYDLYGRGYSDRPNIAYDRKLFVEQLRELLDVLGIGEPVDLVGLSMGGPVIASFIASYPERVAHQVFVDPFVGPVDAGVLTVPGLGDYLAVIFVARTLPKRLAGDFYDPEKVPDWEGRFREQMRYRGFRRALLRSLREFMAEDFSGLYAEVGRLGKPTLVVWGRHDRTVPFALSQQVASSLGARLLVVEEAAHTPHLERPEVFGPELASFLRGEGHGSTPETRSAPVP